MLYNEKWKKPAVKLEPWQQHLLDAAAYICKHGWCQDRPFYLGAACVMGALSETMPARTINHFDTSERLRKHLGLKGDLASWNDKPGRTKEEVIAALEAAAKGE